MLAYDEKNGRYYELLRTDRSPGKRNRIYGELKPLGNRRGQVWRLEENMEGKQIAEVYQIKGCRAYIKRTGLQFSDSEVGTLLFHSGMPYHELHCALKELAERTADQELRRQIEERIAYDERCSEIFRTNDGVSFSQ